MVSRAFWPKATPPHANEADLDYYVQRLCGFYCQQFAHAFTREDFARIFQLPDGPDASVDDDLADVRPIAQAV